MYIKKRTKTKYIILLPTNTDPKEPMSADDIDRKDRNVGRFTIGCHYVVGLDGYVETGRELDTRGNRRRSYNHNSVYVDIVGTKESINDKQIESIEEILQELQDLYPDAEVLHFE